MAKHINTSQLKSKLRQIEQQQRRAINNYNNAVSMQAFKESGAIEYSSDVLIGLQLKGAGKKDFDANEAKKKTPREIELVILKNRNGSTGDRVEFKYYSLFNFFEEV